ncbi:hypothetical protein E1284_35395 [Actinomadura bangladeshensis]|uniref:Tyr recombinase domain-containing protein n=1 Tax=Actinomadura bangladeshensis TaxID=453573 RepID=A0A4R4N924_9ACTN|nr:hypothetical protein E1284_35395 [Actinomadura bangladeshensis]
MVVSELKAARSRRTLVLTPEILTKLRKLHCDRAKARLALGEAWQDHGLVFPVRGRHVYRPGQLLAHLLQARQAGVGLGHWHPHKLRHSGASLVLAQGTPLHVVSDDPRAFGDRDHEGHLWAFGRGG